MKNLWGTEAHEKLKIEMRITSQHKRLLLVGRLACVRRYLRRSTSNKPRWFIDGKLFFFGISERAFSNALRPSTRLRRDKQPRRKFSNCA